MIALDHVQFVCLAFMFSSLIVIVCCLAMAQRNLWKTIQIQRDIIAFKDFEIASLRSSIPYFGEKPSTHRKES